MKNTPPHRRSRPTFRPFLESLETRLTPTTYTVSSLADSGDGSLRAAITSVNADTTPDEIDFSVAGVIQLASDLPAIANTVNIEGTTAIKGSTATGFVNAPLVEIDTNGFDGLTINASNSTLSSLSIVNSGGNGVTLEGGDNITVVGNWIGLALDESVAPNMGGGVLVDNSTGDIIGGTAPADRNVISGNGGIGTGGIDLGDNGIPLAAQNATIEGNLIGTDPFGQPVSSDQWAGILINSNGNTIGGTAAGAGNVIANNTFGIYIHQGTGNSFLGNSIYNNGNGSFFQNDGNQNQQPPTLLFATQTGADTKITGIMNGQANAAYTIQVFASQNDAGGQGQTLLGTVTATTNASGFASYTLNAQVPPNAGSFFTALATSPSNNTSEFGVAIGLSTANQAYVASAYGLLLNRAPEGSGGTIDGVPFAGSQYWVNLLNNGASTATVLLGIQGSDEYLRNQVIAMYERYLQRNPDASGDSAGTSYWVSFLQAGGTFEQVAEGLTSSQEYFALQGSTNQGFVTGLYTEVLNRSASDSEITGWEAALDAGESRSSVSAAFLTSQEYRTDLVQTDYMMFLLRPADSGGLTAFLNALNAGATDQDVLAGIFGSPEGYQLWS